MSNLVISPYKLKNNSSKFDISIVQMERDKSIKFEIIYCEKLFKKGTVERLSRHYIRILDEINMNTAIKLSDTNMFTNEE